MKIFVKKIMIFIYRILNVILPKSDRIIVFSSSNGKSAGGNPRAIYEYAVRETGQNPEIINGSKHSANESVITNRSKCGKKFLIVWFLTDELMKKLPEEAEKIKDAIGKDSSYICKTVRYGHPAYYWYMARAGKWVFDSRQEPYIKKRPGVVYLQTWHGTPLKKLGLDIDGMNMAGESGSIEEYREAFRCEAAQWDYLISQNSFSSQTFRRCFDFKGEMLEIGYPRNDVLVRAAKREKNKADGRKILLYAPTWRDDKYLGGGWYAYSSPLDLEQLYRQLGDSFRIIVKPHYLVKIKKADIPAELIKNGFVSVAGHSDEINDLYLKADGLITDYSSVMFDYSLLGRPMFFFVYDMKEYADVLRGFYFDFEEEAPGPICRTTEELAEAIATAFSKDDHIDNPKNVERNRESYQDKYGSKIRAFTEKYNGFDDGNAAKKAWEMTTTCRRR